MTTAIARRTRNQIESNIRKCAESIQKNGLEIGRDLIEIRDDELWADEYDSWNQYLKDRAAEIIGKSFANAQALIGSAEVAKRLPSTISLDVKTNLHASHFNEIKRLAPNVGKDGERGAEKAPNNTLPKGQRKLDDISRLINAARKVEQKYRETQERHQDDLIEETRLRNDAERRAAEAQAKLSDAVQEISKLKLALKLQTGDFTQSQRKALMPPNVELETAEA